MNSAPDGENLVKEMLAHLEPPMPLVDAEANSKVANFYQDRSVFITGATGYLGKALIEKLIRSCDKIKQIYILVREKRGQGIQERLADLIKSQCFDRIRERNNGSSETLEAKLHAIKGDITLPKFGISPEDLKLLSDECTIVFNSAATIRFVEPIDVAVRNNIFSVGQLIDFCDELKRLEAIVHLSTAYSNCHKRDTIHEIFYEPPMRGDQINEALDKLKVIQDQIHEYKDFSSDKYDQAVRGDDDGTPSRSSCKLQRFYFDNQQQVSSSSSQADILRDFAAVALKKSNRPNTYTFTKAISETYLLDKVRARPDRYLGDKIPVAIVRPSIVGGAWREPKVGLVDNYNGPTGAILSLYTGALQAMPGVGQRVADIVPVDMVTNMVLCAAWFLIEQKRLPESERQKPKHDYGIHLFNFVSGCRNPLHWELVTQNIAKLAYRYPSKFLTRLPSSYFIRAGRLYDLYDLVNQKFPAYIIDLVRSKLFGQQLDRKTSAMFAYTQIRQMTDTLTPFTTNQWKFSDTNVQMLYNLLSPVDKSLFHFDVGSISWPDYITSYIIGARIYTLKDEANNVPKGLAIVKRRKLINGIALTVLFMVVYYVFLSGCCRLGSSQPDS